MAKRRKPGRRQESGSRSPRTPRKVQSISRLEIAGDVKNSIIMVVSGISLLPTRIRERLALYQRRPSAMLLDTPWIGLFLGFLIAVARLLASLAYYGTNIDPLTSISGLLITWRIDSILPTIVATCAVLVVAIQVGRAFRGRRTEPSKPRVTQRALELMPIVGLALAVTLMTSLVIRLSRTTEPRLIKLRPDIAQLRADELVGAGQFDLARDILRRLPYERRAPVPPIVPGLQNTATRADPVVRVQPANDYSQDLPGKEVESLDPAIQALHTLGKIAAGLYNNGEYEAVIETVCEMSHLGTWYETLPYLRSAIYMMAHDARWGPSKTFQRVQGYWDKYPDCREMASPFWMAIPPELAYHIEAKWSETFTYSHYQRYFRFLSPPTTNAVDQTVPREQIRLSCQIDLPPEELHWLWPYYDEWLEPLTKRCEFDLQLTETLLNVYPEDEYADFARFLLGRYDEIITGGYEHNMQVFDLAFYEKGRSQFESGDYEGALKTFQAFLHASIFREHPWRDDARWRLAECYKRLGRYVDALDNLARMDGEPDGGVPGYADMAINVLYIADVMMPIEDLARVVSEKLFPTLQPLLKYTLAERLLAGRRYEESRKVFQEVIQEFGTLNVQIDPWADEIVLLGDLAAKKIKVIGVLTNYESARPKDYPLLLADYLETYEAFSPFENELRLYIPFFLDSDWQPVTQDYLVTRSRHYLSAQLREEFIVRHPDDGRVPDLLLKIAKGYETVASWEYLPPGREFLDLVRQRAVNAYVTYIEQYPRHDRDKFDRALENSGSLFLARCRVGVPHPLSCDIDSVVGMREAYRRLVQLYPEHRLANNMLNWMAWSYCYEANQPETPDEDYVRAYQDALQTYETIAMSYPDGAIGENAQNNILIIREKLAHPSERPEVPQYRWGWTEPSGGVINITSEGVEVLEEDIFKNLFK